MPNATVPPLGGASDETGKFTPLCSDNSLVGMSATGVVLPLQLSRAASYNYTDKFHTLHDPAPNIADHSPLGGAIGYKGNSYPSSSNDFHLDSLVVVPVFSSHL